MRSSNLSLKAAIERNGPPTDETVVSTELWLLATAQGTRFEVGEALRECISLGLWPKRELLQFANGRLVSETANALREKCERRRRAIDAFSCSAFVAQPFDRDDYFDVLIAPCCHLESIRPVRVDRQQKAEGLRVNAKRHMDACTIFIADLRYGEVGDRSDSRENVFYEIGYMQAKGKRGIFICQDLSERTFYVEDEDIIDLKIGPAQLAATRKELRTRLRQICHEPGKALRAHGRA